MSLVAPTASFITFTEKRAKNGTKHFNLHPAGFGWEELLLQAREFKRLMVTSDAKMEQALASAPRRRKEPTKLVQASHQDATGMTPVRGVLGHIHLGAGPDSLEGASPVPSALGRPSGFPPEDLFFWKGPSSLKCFLWTFFLRRMSETHPAGLGEPFHLIYPLRPFL